ncbi:MAG: hypothetical protein ACOYOT_09625 [Bacteroidales bacterium]
MKKTIRLLQLLLIFTFISVIANLPSEVKAQQPTKEDYKNFLDQVEDYKIGENCSNYTKMAGYCTPYCNDVYFYRKTGNPKYLERILYLARFAINEWKTKKAQVGRGYHFPDHYVRMMAFETAYNNTKDASMKYPALTTDEKTILKEVVIDLSTNAFYEGGGMMNRNLSFTAGLTIALRMAPDHPLYKELRYTLDLQLKEIAEVAEISEDSRDYERLTFYYLFSVIDENNMQYLYNDPRLKNLFEYVLNCVNNVGNVAAVGDYGGYPSSSMALLATLEKGAALYKDGRFKTAAKNVYDATVAKYYPIRKEMYDGYELCALGAAYYWGDDNIKPVPLDGKSVLLYRGNGKPDKLYFNSGTDSTSLQVAISLKSGSEHGQASLLAPISITRGNKSYLHDTPDRTSNNTHNTFRVNGKENNFPIDSMSLNAGWKYMTLELDQSWIWGTLEGMPRYFNKTSNGKSVVPILSKKYVYDPEKQFPFNIQGGNYGNGTFYIDGVKLVNSNTGKVIVLEDFEGEINNWIGLNFRKEKGGKVGLYCGAADFSTATGYNEVIGAVFNMPLNVHDSKYNRIEFWYKVASDLAHGNEYVSKVNIADKYMYPHNYFFFLSPMSTSKVGDFFDGETQSNADFTLSAKNNDGKEIAHTRQFLFGKDLLLWTRDIFEMKDSGQYFAGPQWRTEEVEKINNNTYLMTSDGRSLVYFVPRQGESSNIVKNIYTANKKMPNTQVIYQKKKGQGGNSKQDYFESVIIPLFPSDNPQKLAKSISVEYDKNGTTLLKVDETLLLLNPSGTKISAAGLTTDAKTLTLKVKDGKAKGLSATETTMVEFKKASLFASVTRVNIPKLGEVMNHKKVVNPFEK